MTVVIQPGDVLLYRASGLFGRIIQLKTWHPISHVEIALDHGEASASRDGLGVNRYPLRLSELAHVLRPPHFDVRRARAYTEQYAGTPYGWCDLLNFIGLRVDTRGVVCSPWVTMLLRDNGLPIFNHEAPTLIAPFQFLSSECLTEVSNVEPDREVVG